MRPEIAVVMGGQSAEREISLQTGEGVLRALLVLGYPASPVDFGPQFVDVLRSRQPAAVFNALHGGAGEDGTVQALLDWLGVGYQGSGVQASAVAMDKWLTKALLQAEGILAPRGIRLSQSEAATFAIAEKFALPCVVKPKAQGSAVGVSIVRETSAWAAAVRAASIGSAELLVEEYIEGREFTVAIFGDEALPVVEITPHDLFYTYEAKYRPGGSTHTVPARVDASVAQRMQRDALTLHRALGCRDYSRVDFLMDRSGRSLVLECNTLPGLTPLSLFPDAAKAAGITYENVVERLVQYAMLRSRSAE
jgi:D-alanine-D-alanine ligase